MRPIPCMSCTCSIASIACIASILSSLFSPTFLILTSDMGSPSLRVVHISYPPMRKTATSKQSCSTCVQDYDGGGLCWWKGYRRCRLRRRWSLVHDTESLYTHLITSSSITALGSSSAAGPLPDRIAKFREGTRPYPDLFALGVYRSIEVYFFRKYTHPSRTHPLPRTVRDNA